MINIEYSREANFWYVRDTITGIFTSDKNKDVAARKLLEELDYYYRKKMK